LWSLVSEFGTIADTAEAALRLKVVARGEPDMLARVCLVLETQNVVPLCFTARRESVHNRITPILEIEIEFATSDVAPDVFNQLAAVIPHLPGVLTTVVPDGPE
jgi:hypothetical protein